jgi:phytoene synthase
MKVMRGGGSSGSLGAGTPNGTRSIQYCQNVTRRRARNFWYGIRLLPRPKREALAAIYAMSRRIDDVGDGSLPREEKRAALDTIAFSLGDVDAGSSDPVVAALGLAVERFPIPTGAFHDLVEGVRMDVEGVEYATFADLVVYCRRVAGAVGRLSLGVFGATRMAEAEPLADDLGVAMQLTNILRDVREDLGRGRVYIPADELERFECSRFHLRGPARPATMQLLRFQARRAESWFGRGLGLLPQLDRRSAACAGAMAGIYLRLLRQIERRPEAVLTRRVSLPGWQKAWVAARALTGGIRAPLGSSAAAPGGSDDREGPRGHDR